MGLSNLENWIEGKDAFLCQFAIEAVSGIEDMFSACMVGVRLDLSKQVDDPAFVHRWAGFYADIDSFHELTCKFISRDASPEDRAVFQSANDPQAMTNTLQDAFQSQTKGMSDAELKAWFEHKADQNKLRLEQQLKDLRHGRKPESDFVPQNDREAETLLFYFKVWLPCWLEYQQYLPVLMAQAVQGDLSALRKLLRLDRWVLEHDPIRHVWQKATAKLPRLADDLHKAAQEKPLENITMTNLKYLFGALIYQLFQKTDSECRKFESQSGRPYQPCKISAEEIYRLFVAYALDIGGQPTDPDLESPGAFRAGISRYKNYWNSLFE